MDRRARGAALGWIAGLVMFAPGVGARAERSSLPTGEILQPEGQGLTVPGQDVELPPKEIAPAFEEPPPQGQLTGAATTLGNQAAADYRTAAIAPQENPLCPRGQLVISTGAPDHNILLRPLEERASVAKPVTARAVMLPYVVTEELAGPNVLLKSRRGELIEIRLGALWDPITPKPSWWDQVAIQGRPYGARMVAFVWRSTDCGQTWERISVLDPATVEQGRFAVPRASEPGCEGGCFGGWEHLEGYADPWTGHLYLSMFAAGGPIIDPASGRVTDEARSNHFVFRSTDGGASWRRLLALDAWTPIVMTSTPNGRLYLYSVIERRPTLFYSLLNGRGPLKLSPPRAIHFPIAQAAERQPLLAGGDSAYAQVVHRSTHAISRISTDRTSSRVRLSYPFIDASGHTALAAVHVDITSDDAAPMVTPLNTIHASPGASVLASTFVDPDTSGASRGGSNSALLYWIEGTAGDRQPATVRYSIFRDELGGTTPLPLGAPFSLPAGRRPSLPGSAYLAVEGSLHFVAPWVEASGLRAATVTLPPEPGPLRYCGLWRPGETDHPSLIEATRQQLDARLVELRDQGYGLVSVSAAVPPGGKGERWSAVWVKGHEERTAAIGLTREEFDRRATQLHDHHHFAELNSYLVPGGGERFNGIWVKSREPRQAIWGWKRADFEKKQADLQTLGFRLAIVNATVDGDEERWNAVWVKSSEERPAAWGLPRAELEQRDARLRKRGFRLAELSGHGVPNQGARFNAVWVKSNAEVIAGWGMTRWDLERRLEDLGAQAKSSTRLYTLLVK